jgi:DNA-binding CsgD family transcriptional regulator
VVLLHLGIAQKVDASSPRFLYLRVPSLDVDPPAEFYGVRLLAWHAGTISALDRNRLIKAAWPKTPPWRWVIPRSGGVRSPHAVKQTRLWIGGRVELYIDRLIKKHGSLEVAVRAGHARGFPRWLRWRFKDEFRRGSRDPEVYLTRLHPGQDVAEGPRVHLERGSVPDLSPLQVGQLSDAEQETWLLYRQGLTFQEIGVETCRRESTIRKRVRKIERTLGLSPRPRWQHRVQRCDFGPY